MYKCSIDMVLGGRLNKILASYYYNTSPEMKVIVEVVAVVEGNDAHVQGSSISIEITVQKCSLFVFGWSLLIKCWVYY